MAPALCLPPTILDQSFPREAKELERAAGTLGVLQGLTERGRCFLLLTPALMSFHECFEWAGVRSYPLLLDLHRLVTQWLLQPTRFIRCVSTLNVAVYSPHPAPAGGTSGVLVDIWREETGKIHAIYMSRCARIRCIGVACDFAFAGLPLGAYEDGLGDARFPLVGPAGLRGLADFDEWVIPADLHRWSVRFADAKRNLHLVGGAIADKAEGSHYKVKFEGAPRSWVLDVNVDPIPDAFIAEIEPLAGLPSEVIKFALVCGELPERRPRF
jgi:hypothetical protein